MSINILVYVLSLFVVGLLVWIFTSCFYKRKIENLRDGNSLYSLLNDFKTTIDNYQKSHEIETITIKNAVSTAEKYAKALTTNQNVKGEFGEEWLEQILKFANLTESVHYTKQYCAGGVKPDIIVNLPDEKSIIIDSKVILKNYIEYANSDENPEYKKCFITDITNCINQLAKKNYEELEQTSQPGFILMYIPIESCINLIYTDCDFRRIIELANSKNIIIVGTASLLVALRLINRLWASKTASENIGKIIETAQNLYNNIALHSQNLLNIENTLKTTYEQVHTEINRFTQRNNGSVFKEAEKLLNFGIGAKVSKSGKKTIQNTIAEEFLK